MAEYTLDTESESSSLIYFQNLVPGTQESSFIERYKSECLNDESAMTQMRKQLLNEFPPVLSFNIQQKKKFYEEEARNCQQFCCAGMGLDSDLMGNSFLKPKDNYMLSIGTGTFYEGSREQIKEEMQTDVRQEQFGSAKQEQLISGIKLFDDIVAHRDQKPATSQAPELEQKSERNTQNPFNTKPDPYTDQ